MKKLLKKFFGEKWYCNMFHDAIDTKDNKWYCKKCNTKRNKKLSDDYFIF